MLQHLRWLTFTLTSYWPWTSSQAPKSQEQKEKEKENLDDSCRHCQLDASLRRQGIWIHVGRKRPAHNDAQTVGTLRVHTVTDTSNLHTIPRTPVADVFVSREDRAKANREEYNRFPRKTLSSQSSAQLAGRCEYDSEEDALLRIGRKPENVAWFSHGRWLFDSYCDSTCEDHYESLSESLTSSSTLFALSRKDLVLEKLVVLETGSQIKAFELKYSQPLEGYDSVASSNNKFARRFLLMHGIDWDRVRSDGYSGCIIDVNRQHPIVCDSFVSGYDVESLFIWDWSCVTGIARIESSIHIA